MAKDLRRYPKLDVLINNQYQEELTDCEVSWDSGLIDILTMDGLSGFAEGPALLSISGTVFVPGSPEFNFAQAAHNKDLVDMQVAIGGVSVVARGVIKNARLSGSTGDGTKMSFEFTARSAKLS